MNKIKFKFYLAGPIWNENLNDNQHSWREILTKELKGRNCLAIDPTLKKNDDFAGENVAEVLKYRTIYGFNGEKTKKIIDWIYFEDLRLIESSDAIIAFLPKKVQSFGTAQELFYNYHVLKRNNFSITDMDLIKDSSVFLQKTTTKFYSSIPDFISNFNEVLDIISNSNNLN
jgi:nucleoside 2-deoxyribosyltransferase